MTQKQHSQCKEAGHVIQTILATKPENASQLIDQLKAWTANQSFLTTKQKEQVHQLIDRFSQLPATKQTVEVFAKQMQEQLLKAFAQNTADRLFTQDASALSSKDHLLSLIRQEAPPIAK